MTTPPFDDRDGFIWMDGKIIPWRDARIHVLSHALHYGGSVFEGERIYGNNIFKRHEHSARLIRSAELIDMTIPFSVEEIENASQEVAHVNNITDGYIRPLAWRGTEQMNVSAHACSVHVAIACWEWPQYFFPKSGEEGGVALKTSRWRRPDPRTAPVQSKTSGNYTIGTMAKHEAEAAEYDDALMLDLQGQVAEASGANLFMIKDGAIKTPIPDSFLNGLTRQTVIKMAQELGFELEETRIMPEELLLADEVFLTGTAAEVAPVGRIDDTEYKTGPVTKQLKDAYADLVRTKDKNALSA